jgi:hypothetical protein
VGASEETLQAIEPNSNEAAKVAEAIGVPIGGLQQQQVQLQQQQQPVVVVPRGGSKLVLMHSASEEHVGPGGEMEDEVKVNGNGDAVVAET